MSPKAKVALFIVAFCALLILPFAANAGSKTEAPEPSLDTPTINAMSDKQCVESTEYMRSSHMQLLDQWRTDVVRGGDTQYVSSTGQVYEKSLDDTCLGCHSNPEEFCDTCHSYSGVTLYCWDCHGVSDDGTTMGK